MNEPPQVYRYRVGPADTIDHVDRWWLAFAKENNASELQAEAVLGIKIWDFISDQPTRELYREIHARVRRSGQPISVPFRCDSPTLQRFMELRISKLADDSLIYESKLVQTRWQRRQGFLEPGRVRSGKILTMCSICKRSLIKPFAWVELENIALQLRLYDDQTVPELQYTVCPRCTDRCRGE